MRPSTGFCRWASSSALSLLPKYTYCGCLPCSTSSTMVMFLVSTTTCSPHAITLMRQPITVRITFLFIVLLFFKNICLGYCSCFCGVPWRFRSVPAPVAAASPAALGCFSLPLLLPLQQLERQPFLVFLYLRASIFCFRCQSYTFFFKPSSSVSFLHIF